MPSLTVSLRIPKDELLRYYRGSAKTVIATATNGQTVRFPVEVLRPFVTRDGISGHFNLYFTTEGRFERIEKLNI